MIEQKAKNSQRIIDLFKKFLFLAYSRPYQLRSKRGNQRGLDFRLRYG